jgi:hypothetical protein
MYEMEGPRLCPGALVTRLLGGRTPRSYHQRQAPAVSTGRPALPASPSVSLGPEPVFSGEEFLLPTAPTAQGLSAISSRFFCRPQDICRLSPVHSSFPLDHAQVCPHFLWITSLSVAAGIALRVLRCAYWRPAQKRCRGWPARLGVSVTGIAEGQTMSPDSLPPAPGRADRAAVRDRNRARIRTVTAAAGLTSILTAGAVAYTLPGSTQAATASAQSSVRSGGSSHLSSSGSTSSSSGSALKSTSAPSASSGSPAVTSGGS